MNGVGDVAFMATSPFLLKNPESIRRRMTTKQDPLFWWKWRILKMKKHRHRILGAVLFVLYLVLLTYFLFFAEEMGRSPDARAEYSYNLTLFKEIRRFLLYRNILGWRAVFLNIFGNVLAFMPFGFFLPVIWERTRHWYITVLLSFAMSLLVETMQLVGKVGSFDVDDLLLNTIGGFAGYIIFVLARGVWERYSGTNRK